MGSFLMKTTLLAAFAAIDVYAITLQKNIMLADISSLSPQELMQRCHKKPSDCNGMYKIPVKKLEAIVKAKEIKVKAAKMLAQMKIKKSKNRALCANKVPLAILKKPLAARIAGKCIKIHLKFCKDNIAKLPLCTLKKIVVHKKAVHIMKKIVAKKQV